MSEARSCLLIGLPRAGKTTFLAALWHVAESGEIPGSLRVQELRGDWEHLNRIRGRWCACEELPRTTVEGDAVVSMILGADGTGESVEVIFPDLGGESFSLQWVSRKCSRAYYELAQRAVGVMLCIHPRVKAPVLISHIEEVAGALGGAGAVGDSAGGESAEGATWNPEDSPTQVQLVGLLQFLVHPPFQTTSRRIAVVISAWDLVADDGRSPAEWLSANLPLLDQYLKANSGLYEMRVYGLSGQGGDLESDRERLQRIPRPSDRIDIVGEGVAGHDVTTPIKWLMA